MSKRTRGSTRSRRRPGARPASSRPTARRRESAASRSFTEAAPLADEQLEQEPAMEVAEAQPAADVRPAPRMAHPRQRAKPGSLLAARAATEYVYVAEDLKRIGVLSVLLFGALFALWVLIVILRVIPLPFY